MAGFAVAGTIVATPGEGDRLAGHLLDAAAALEDVDDCHLYLVHRVADDPDAVHVVEAWTDAAAHQRSLELEAVRTLIGAARPIIADMRDRVVLTPLGGKGMPASG